MGTQTLRLKVGYELVYRCPQMVLTVLMARGRDAADVAIVTTSGPNLLESYGVWADEFIGAQV